MLRTKSDALYADGMVAIRTFNTLTKMPFHHLTLSVGLGEHFVEMLNSVRITDKNWFQWNCIYFIAISLLALAHLVCRSKNQNCCHPPIAVAWTNGVRAMVQKLHGPIVENCLKQQQQQQQKCEAFKSSMKSMWLEEIIHRQAMANASAEMKP